MKTRLFTLLLAVAASLGTMRATDVTIDGISYNLDTYELTAELTASVKNGDVIIPPTVENNGQVYDVTSIANNAFSVGEWTSVVIPSSITFIGGGAFSGTQSPQYVEMESLTPPLVSSSSFPAALPVYVPCDALSTYKANSTWANFLIGYKPKSHHLSVTCNTNNKGTVKIVRNTICDEGDISTATLTVSPKYGYVFTMWSDGNIDNPRVIELSKDTTLTALFASNNTDVSSIIVDGNSYSVSTQVAVPVEYGYTGKPTIQITPSANTSTINVLQEANLPTIDTYRFEVVAENDNAKQYSITIYPVTNFTANDIISGTQSHSIIATTTGSIADEWWNDCATMIQCSEDWGGITSSSKYIEFRTTGKKEISFVRYLSYSGNGYDSEIPIRMWKSSEIDDNYIESTTRCSSNQYDCSPGGYSNLILPDGVQVLRIYGQERHKVLGNFSVSVRNSEYYSILYNYNENEGSVEGPTSARPSSIVTFTAVPKEGYHFTQWSDGVTDNPRSIILSQDTTFSAEFAANTKFVVNFVDWNDTIISSMEVEEGYAAVAPANPSREGYEFIGWDKDYSHVTSDMTITAQYAVNYYPVGFLNYDGTLLSEQSIEYNQAAMEPNVPAREGYTFIGWTADIEHITARTFAIALYEKDGINVTYISEEGDTIVSERVDMHLPDAPVVSGKTFTGWLTESASNAEGIVFRASYTLDNPTTGEDVVVIPTSSTAGVSFPYITGAMTYMLVIRDLFGTVVCKIMFDADGHLLGIAFAPGRNRTQKAQSEGFHFTVEGLTPGTTYEYEFVAYDEADQVIETLTGSFETTDDETGVNNISSTSAPQKIINDGHVFVLRGDKTYTLQGQEVK